MTTDISSVLPPPMVDDDAPEIEVRGPATSKPLGWVPCLNGAAVEELVARARTAQVAWGALPVEERAAVFARTQRWMLRNVGRILDTVVAETGKAREDAQLTDFAYGAQALGFWASTAPKYLAERRIHSSNRFLTGKRLALRYVPRGVVGVIGPWNFPLLNSFGDCIPALVAGNAVILKPSELTPFTSLLMAEALEECGLPPDVFLVATGDGATGAAVVDTVDYVMFTGSVATGRAVARRAAERLVPFSLELGGNDPMIVLADADLERAANGAVYYGMLNAGQTCIAIERVYAERPIYEEFVRRVAHKAAALRLGPPGDFGSVDVGAITSPAQIDVIAAHVTDAVARGARLVTGGSPFTPPEGGAFFEPTVLADTDHTMRIMRHETFGPVVPIMPVNDASEAVALANDSDYGLQASVWTRDVERGRAIAGELQAGMVSVNDHALIYTALEIPSAGRKSSGIGARHGEAGITRFCHPQGVLVAPRYLPKRELNMYPYRRATSQALGAAIRLANSR